jgi:ribonuclease J
MSDCASARVARTARTGAGHWRRGSHRHRDELRHRRSGGPDKLVAVVASGQNVDRLVSCFKAARRSGRQLVIDPYQAYVLMKLAPLSKNIPQFSWDGVRVSFPPHQVERLKAAGLMGLAREMAGEGRVSSDQLAERPGRYLLCTRGSYGLTKLLDKIGAQRVVLVWSMWRGYWRGGSAVRRWAESRGVEPRFIHSGGHAWPEDLARLASSIEAKQTVYVHTDA